MAKKQIPSVPTPAQFATVKEVEMAIAKLHRRVAEVEALNAETHRYDGPERETAQSNIRNTILEVFGPSSPEYHEHRYHKIERGPMIIGGGASLWQSNFRNGIPQSAGILRGLIARLQEKKLDLESDPPSVDAVSEPVATRPTRVFIGHGRSTEWLKLKDFLVERLGLAYEEFNRESPAGFSTKERLQQMLNTSNFAFLVMTSEDQHADGTRHARENVIHEVGLFQGAHSFERAIVLLEDGCEEFSNISGIIQIRFPKGYITAACEEIRKVLERERVIAKGA